MLRMPLNIARQWEQRPAFPRAPNLLRKLYKETRNQISEKYSSAFSVMTILRMPSIGQQWEQHPAFPRAPNPSRKFYKETRNQISEKYSSAFTPCLRLCRSGPLSHQ